MSLVTTVTTSMLTKWTIYSQCLLAHHTPEWNRVIVDGRFNWHPLMFVQEITSTRSKYILHIDEDCFLLNRQGILKIVEEMEEREDIVAAGIPDGGIYYREKNAAALNLFFVLFRRDALLHAWDMRAKWHEY